MATVPTEVTAVAGTVLTAATWNANVRDAMNFILTPPLAVLRQTVSQSLAGNAFNAITFDTEDMDRDNGHSTVSNTSQYVAQTPGWYDVEMTDFANNIASAGFIAAAFSINGTTTAKATHPTNTGFTTSVTTGSTVFANVGNVIVAYLINGATVAGTTSVSSDGACRLTARWVSN